MCICFNKCASLIYSIGNSHYGYSVLNSLLEGKKIRSILVLVVTLQYPFFLCVCAEILVNLPKLWQAWKYFWNNKFEYTVYLFFMKSCRFYLKKNPFCHSSSEIIYIVIWCLKIYFFPIFFRKTSILIWYLDKTSFFFMVCYQFFVINKQITQL